MGNCISRGFGVSDNVEKTEEMSNTKMGRGLELPDDYSTYGVTGRGYRNRCREPCDYYKNTVGGGSHRGVDRKREDGGKVYRLRRFFRCRRRRFPSVEYVSLGIINLTEYLSTN
nr:hypothetical protein Iba_chr05dCG0320 [Ipomoea batatas]GME15674.1 hypothetical protein Iba_scaffold16448CG0080 [Ipomoea batatas]